MTLREYEYFDGDGYPNVKYIFSGRINLPAEQITLIEGDEVKYFTGEQIPCIRFANILKMLMSDYIVSKGNQD
jgi:hypothetical protein